MFKSGESNRKRLKEEGGKKRREEQRSSRGAEDSQLLQPCVEAGREGSLAVAFLPYPGLVRNLGKYVGEICDLCKLT